MFTNQLEKKTILKLWGGAARSSRKVTRSCRRQTGEIKNTFPKGRLEA